MTDSGSEDFRILFVCTANIHRSAMAEQIMKSLLGESAPVHVSSAGIRAVDGDPMGARSAAALRDLGIVPGEHRARRLRTGDVLGSDLILTAEAAHRDDILKESPRAMRRAFTLKEFSRLCEAKLRTGTLADLPHPPRPADLVELIKAIAAMRGKAPIPLAGEDVDDPVRASPEVTLQCAREILVNVEQAVRILGLS